MKNYYENYEMQAKNYEDLEYKIFLKNNFK